MALAGRKDARLLQVKEILGDGGHQDLLVVVGIGVSAQILVLDRGAQEVGDQVHALHDLDLAPVRLALRGDGGQGVHGPGNLGLDAVVDQDQLTVVDRLGLFLCGAGRPRR